MFIVDTALNLTAHLEIFFGRGVWFLADFIVFEASNWPVEIISPQKF